MTVPVEFAWRAGRARPQQSNSASHLLRAAGLPGARAAERAPETSLAPGKRLEPVHLLGVFDTSIHVCLPADRGRRLTTLGWAEPHQYEDFGSEFMIYGPRTVDELDVVMSIIEESLAFARGVTT